MQLFYNKNISLESKQIIFDKIESRHIVRVLRKKEGDILHITNGKGFLFTCKINIVSDKKCLAIIIKEEKIPKHWDYYLHIAIAPTKNNDRFEWFLEKATEIGIDEITPIICQNSERKIVKIERMKKIVQAAMKQSLKFTLPKLNDPIKFATFIKQKFEGQLLIAHCKDEEKVTLKNILQKKQPLTILIGPEGDFSLAEVEQAFSKKFKPISLGNSRLRTETAGVFSVSTVAIIL